MPPDQKKKECLIREKPLLETFWLWVEKNAVSELTKSKLPKAFGYALNHRQEFFNYLEDGHCSISNSLAENGIRGRSGTDSGCGRLDSGGNPAAGNHWKCGECD